MKILLVKIISSIILLCSFCFLNNTIQAQSIDSLFSELKKEKHYKNQAKILLDISELYRYEGNFEKSDSCIQIAIEKSDANNDLEKKGECYNYLGINANIVGNLNKSYTYFEKALDISVELNDSVSMANFYENLGLTLKDDGKYKEAIKMQMKALNIREELANNSRLSSTYLNIGVLFKKINDLEKSRYYIRKALEVAKLNKETSTEQYASIYNEIGNLFDHKIQLDSSLFYYKLCYQYAEKDNWLKGKAAALGNIANAYYETEDYKNALITINESIKLSDASGDVLSLTYDIMYKAGIYFEIDSVKKAETTCEKVYKIALENNFYNELEDINALFSKIYEKQGKFEKALLFHKKYKEISDSLYSENRIEYMHDLEKKYQTKLKEQEIVTLSAKNKTKNIILGAVVFGFVLFLILILSLILIRKKKQEIKYNTLKQKLFRAQLNPHFLFNALGSIQNFMHSNDAKKATFYLGSFSSLIRSILNNSQKELITLEDEIQTLNNYINLECMRVKDAFSFSIKTEDNLETEFILIPPMLLQPFVENSIKHGFVNEVKNPKLEIKFSELNNMLNISIQDNGIGINNSNKIVKQKGHESFALKVFEERLKAIRGKFKKSIKYSIVDLSEMDDFKNGTEVNIKLPLIYN